MDKDLTLALRIKADLSEGQKSIEQLGNTLTALNVNANEAAAGANKLESEIAGINNKNSAAINSTTALNESVQQLNAELAATNTSIEPQAAAFTYAGKTAFSLRDSYVATSVASQTLNTELNNTEATKNAEQSLEQLLSQLQATQIALTKLTATEEQLKESFKSGKVSAEQYAAGMTAIANKRNDLNKVAGAFGNMRYLAQQAGYQIQDIVVQMQTGTNAAVIFSEQGSQLVGAFSPIGGAVVAIVGALAGAFIPSLINSGKAAEDMAAHARELTKDLKDLSDEQQEVVNKATGYSIESEQKKYETLTKQIEEQKKVVDALADAKNKAASATDNVGGGGFGSVDLRTDYTKLLATATQNLTEKQTALIVSQKALDALKNPNKDYLDQLRYEAEITNETGLALVEAKNKHEGLTGAELIEANALGLLIQKKLADKKATEEALAAQKKLDEEAKAKAKAALDYVKNLEDQAAGLNKNKKVVDDLKNAEKGLTTEYLKRAQIAQQTLRDAQDKQALDSLEIQLLQAQGKNQEAAQLEFKEKYDKFLESLGDKSKAKGKALVDNLFNLQGLQEKLETAQKAIDKATASNSTQENSINVQREAGLISEYEAREKILKLHQDTYAILEKQRPVLEALQKQGGVIGENATKSLDSLKAQEESLLYTTSLLESTLKDGLTSGLTDALTGLADGTKNFSEAISALGHSVSEALIQMSANALSEEAVSGIMGLFSSGSGNKKSDQTAGAAATTTAAAALAEAGGVVLTAAQAMLVSAHALAAAGAGSSLAGSAGDSGGDSSDVNYGQLFSTVASLFAATGGHVTGPGTATSDSIPAMLSNNEYVTRAAVVQQPNALNFLHDFNMRGMSALDDWSRVRHSTGGLAGVPAPAMPSPTLGNANLPEPAAAFSSQIKNNQTFNLIDDPARIASVMASPAGQENIFVTLSRNPSRFRSILGI